VPKRVGVGIECEVFYDLFYCALISAFCWLKYENNETLFFSRIAVRQDTCAMVAISLNIQQKVHPIIWSMSNLPFDCTQAIPVKKPLGGTLVVAINALIYLNQSVPPFGVSLNSINDISTNFPLSEL